MFAFVNIIFSVYATIKIIEPVLLNTLYPKGIFFHYSSIGFIPFGSELSGSLHKFEPYDACSMSSKDYFSN